MKKPPRDQYYAQCKSLEEIVRVSMLAPTIQTSTVSYARGMAPSELVDTIERQKDLIARLQDEVARNGRRMRAYRKLAIWRQLMLDYERGKEDTNPEAPGVYLALRPSNGRWMPTRWDGHKWMTAIKEDIKEWANL